jgi:hypothetical protein
VRSQALLLVAERVGDGDPSRESAGMLIAAAAITSPSATGDVIDGGVGG